jgi:hypothetical protein
MIHTQDDPVVSWLLEGDPSTRWQVMRDLLDEPTDVWKTEQRRTVQSGWVEHPSRPPHPASSR